MKAVIFPLRICLQVRWGFVLLSYRHSYHAGNFADVLKHIVLVEIFDYLTKKDKSFDYMDTHAGAGLFNLKSNHAAKLEEHTQGIDRLHRKDWPELSKYFEVIDAYNNFPSTTFYPGSPLIAKYFLRPQDKAWFYELHPKDFQLLGANVAHDRRIKIYDQDGFSGLLALLPPISRRGFIFIDPSYEVKVDYERVYEIVSKAYKKFSTGIYVVWYPVVSREKIDRLEKKFIKSGIKNIQRFEVGIDQDSDARGMTSSGMFVINAPWGLFVKMGMLLPKLSKSLGAVNSALFRCDVLTTE